MQNTRFQDTLVVHNDALRKAKEPTAAARKRAEAGGTSSAAAI
jgi:hypothetical protein